MNEARLEDAWFVYSPYSWQLGGLPLQVPNQNALCMILAIPYQSAKPIINLPIMQNSDFWAQSPNLSIHRSIFAIKVNMIGRKSLHNKMW